MHKQILAIITALILGTATAVANPQPQSGPWIMMPAFVNCADNDSIQEVLEKYSEIQLGSGKGTLLIPGPNEVVQGRMSFYLSPNDFTYTIVLGLEDGFGCIVIMGSEFTPHHEGKQE